MNETDVIGLVLLGLLIVGSFIALANQQEKLDDPENTEMVYLEQLREICVLPENGVFLLRTIRQSGNLQKEDQQFNGSSEAIKRAVSTFRRAKIDYAVISKNTPEAFAFRRPYHDHRGTNEGKKVGAVEIQCVG